MSLLFLLLLLFLFGIAFLSARAVAILCKQQLETRAMHYSTANANMISDKESGVLVSCQIMRFLILLLYMIQNTL